MKPTYIALDGNWALWRAWSTLGENTSDPPARISAMILDWFCSAALRFKATGGLVAFDGPNNFRYLLYKNYKSNRGSSQEEPSVVKSGPFQGLAVHDAVYQCLPRVMSDLRDLGVCVVQEDTFEADDVLNSFSIKVTIFGGLCVIVTRDKDMIQCVNSNCQVFQPAVGTQKEFLYTKDTVLTTKNGLSPLQFLDYQILMGDSIDMVPAIEGMSHPKALETIKKAGSLQQWFSTREGRKFYNKNRSELHRNKDLVTLSRKAFNLKVADTAFSNLKGDTSCRTFTMLKGLQTKHSLF